MSSTTESAKKSSDLPWMIGSAVVFGPAFLYLLSPASRKSAPHDSHHEKHDKSHADDSKAQEPIKMKDDEGTEANVTESVHKAEAEDVPKADSAAKESEPEEKTQAPATPPEEAKKDTEPVPKEPAGTKDEPGPTEQGQVRGKATEPDPESPKSTDEKVKEEKKSNESS
ncbi:hypothetical protein GYMLUDRAFT_79809 [Collybiopsis luxurians FD-317 M1]|nr:hypothetical protein GYMLUDRAFT_79809 [Collybiopsis luxurians FD-317 M1]